MVHVSKLEIRGFKSFGHKKETFPLSPGLTAIVGPNGSGKSNVVDAISFVLGQRSSKTLRASEFSDLIYHGSEGENGKNPAPYAKVKLHISNDDGSLPIDSDEVTVSRKVNHDGKSTYRINEKRSTRQEIVDLLSGEIIGTEGYNFVMQGDVGKFIKMSSLERRKIIDDLAGIAEFEEKKSKALSELEEVETRLQGQEGRLEELEQNMKRLKREREDALKFQDLQKKLKKKKAKLAQIKIDSCKENLNHIRAKIEEKDEKLEEFKEKQKKLENKRKNLKEEKKGYQELIQEKRESETLSRVEKLKSRIETLQERLKESEKTHEELKEKIKDLQEKAREIAQTTEEKSPLRKIENLSDQFQGFREKFKKTVNTINSTEVGSEKFEKSFSKLRRILEEIGSTITKLEKQLQKILRSKEDFLQLAEEVDKVEESGSEFERLKSRLASTKALKEDTEKQIGELKEKVEKSKSSLKEAEDEAEEIRSEIKKSKEKIEEIESEISELKKRSNELDERIEKIKDRKTDLRENKASAETELKQAEEDLRSYYDMGEVEISKEDPEKLKEEVNEIEKEIKKLKPINERAIEGYKEVKERYDSQKENYNKITEEKQTLLDFMKEIDQKKTEVFMETYEEVSENFSEIFSEMSPGGEGRLILENPDDPLDGGLEIEAKPRGKKLKNAESLSGGEKALTGLTFIFAIQRTQPSGLYVLDEIDAHLDPENQKEVAKMVKRFAQESQIIVVTIRDSMMSVADKLFGINMDEDNISHVVSVDLEKMKEENYARAV